MHLPKFEQNKCNSLAIRVFAYHICTNRFVFPITKLVKITQSAKINSDNSKLKIYFLDECLTR